MSYEQHTWTNNQLITASKLNNIEQGITEAAQSGGSSNLNIVITQITYSNGKFQLNKTWQELFNADICFAISLTTGNKCLIPIVKFEYNEGTEYSVYVFNLSNFGDTGIAENEKFSCLSTDSYPQHS